MIIDLEMVDRWFEIGYQYGSPIAFGIFDKRVLLSFEQAALELRHATEEIVTSDALATMAARGWIPLFRPPDAPEAEMGVPLYTAARLALLLALEREGYAADELRIIAEIEEQTIDHVLTTDELAYIDDDLELITQHLRDILRDAQQQKRETLPLTLAGGTVTCEQYERQLQRLQRLHHEGIPEHYAYSIAKDAFRIRAARESARLFLLEMDHSKIRAGYSPFVLCFGETWHFAEEPTFTAHEGIDWEPTVHSALAHTDGEIPRIRVPGFLLSGEQIVSTKTLTPKAYEQLWKQHDLDRYLQIWATVQGQYRCLHCLATLHEASRCRRRYCSEKCRNAAKQKRYRQRNPEAIHEAQRKYWSTI